jgi:hypothetical protein
MDNSGKGLFFNLDAAPTRIVAYAHFITFWTILSKCEPANLRDDCFSLRLRISSQGDRKRRSSLDIKLYDPGYLRQWVLWNF